ncbi:MAG TPA: hypothetical protein DIW64_16465 [Cellvibrio sp.]|nr:hypothetical protein [Cellvibrio sp.]
MESVNSILSEINGKISTRKRFQDNFPRFIYKIRFPVFKNLASGVEINFSHPLTIFVGQNGCGKSSALHALAGAPFGQSVGNRWFSTVLDPIVEGAGRPNCYIYSYYNHEAKKIVEVIKTRVRFAKMQANGRIKKNNDYWEPKRADTGYGMELPQLIDGKPEPGSEASRRWKIPKIDVLYLDFRSELSAFDQYFYFGDRPVKLKLYLSKQDRLRAWIRNKLAPLLLGKADFVLDRTKQKLNKKPVIELDESALNIISEILGKSYTGCKMVEHSIFGSSGYSALFSANNLKYSEAFAGSGEMAVVRLVQSVLKAEPNSLILLDEPEVSLHPGAQKRLRNFLLKCCAEHGHQVVMCSHSPIFLEGLPDTCIKVFYPDTSGKFNVAENVSVTDAFVHIGQTIHNKSQIVVEDSAAAMLIERAFKTLGAQYANVFDVSYSPGGESAIYKDMVVHARNSETKRFAVFDGDVFIEEWPDDRDIGENQLEGVIEKFTGQTIKNLAFRFDGGDSEYREAEKILIKRSFLKYIAKHCFFLPCNTPEEVIWNVCNLNNKASYEHGVDHSDKNRFKIYIGNYVRSQVGDEKSESRRIILKQMLNINLDENHPDFIKLLNVLRQIKLMTTQVV